MKWKNVTDCFTEEQRNYNNKYLEIDEVYGEKTEVSLFSSKDDDYEIYVSYGIMFGIVYVEKDKAEELRQEIKQVIEEEYKKNKEEPSGDFINNFGEKYNICMPNDLFFNLDSLFDIF